MPLQQFKDISFPVIRFAQFHDFSEHGYFPA